MAQDARVVSLREYARLSRLKFNNGYASYLEVLLRGERAVRGGARCRPLARRHVHPARSTSTRQWGRLDRHCRRADARSRGDAASKARSPTSRCSDATMRSPMKRTRRRSRQCARGPRAARCPGRRDLRTATRAVPAAEAAAPAESAAVTSGARTPPQSSRRCAPSLRASTGRDNAAEGSPPNTPDSEIADRIRLLHQTERSLMQRLDGEARNAALVRARREADTRADDWRGFTEPPPLPAPVPRLAGGRPRDGRAADRDDRYARSTSWRGLGSASSSACAAARQTCASPPSASSARAATTTRDAPAGNAISSSFAATKPPPRSTKCSRAS